MARDLGVADRLREFGFEPVEIDNWKNRGRDDFAPVGAVDHHTAGARVGNVPSLQTVIHGRADLPGPLCHVLIGRDNVPFVIASGTANHAGRGTWRGLANNRSLFGVERENVGTPAEPWRPDQLRTAARVHAALLSNLPGTAKEKSANVCLHREYAPTRKIDPHSTDGAVLRAMVLEELEKNREGRKNMDFDIVRDFDANRSYRIEPSLAVANYAISISGGGRLKIFARNGELLSDAQGDWFQLQRSNPRALEMYDLMSIGQPATARVRWTS